MRGVTVAFDLDGTMVDTAPDLIAALDHLLGRLGLPPSDPAVAIPAVGHGARAMIDRAVHALGHRVDPADMDPLIEEFIAFYAQNIAVGSRPFPGLEGTLHALKGGGTRLAVCTNKREALARKLLDELSLSHFFDALAGGDTYPERKPDPAHLLNVIRAAGGDPSAAVMVGDSSADVGAARAAGVPVVLVDFGYADAALNADAVISHFAELPAAVAALTRGPARDAV
ncbi:MAG: phosphoglycolate phosphatase [Hyphomicrobiales bacterium]|nr:phosphoglycolate phosphatase [Hyphomicrobiales bacterium]